MLKVARFLCLIHTFRDNWTILVYILKLYSEKINFSCFQQILFYFLGAGDTLISIILKFTLSVAFLYWKSDVPSNRINLSFINFKYIN